MSFEETPKFVKFVVNVTERFRVEKVQMNNVNIFKCSGFIYKAAEF